MQWCIQFLSFDSSYYSMVHVGSCCLVKVMKNARTTDRVGWFYINVSKIELCDMSVTLPKLII